MASASKLSLAFVDRRPAAAARVLESLPAGDAAAFIETVPTRYAIKVLAPMNAPLAADIVQRLDEASAAAVLREMEFAAASALLRQVAPESRRPILAELSDRRRREFETALAFAADSVGANMCTDVVTVTGEETVAEALKRVREDRDGRSDAVFVIDSQRKLRGSIPLRVLARQRAKTAVAELADPSCASVYARARISRVAAMALWSEYNQLPVVSRRGELVGVLYRQSLAAGAHGSDDESETGEPSIAGSMLHMLLRTAPDLAALMASTSARVSEPGKSRGR